MIYEVGEASEHGGHPYMVLEYLGEPLVLRGHDDAVGAVSFSPDGTRIAFASWKAPRVSCPARSMSDSTGLTPTNSKLGANASSPATRSTKSSRSRHGAPSWSSTLTTAPLRSGLADSMCVWSGLGEFRADVDDNQRRIMRDGVGEVDAKLRCLDLAMPRTKQVIGLPGGVSEC